MDIINTVVILRFSFFLTPYTNIEKKKKPESTFQGKKKKLAQFPKQKPHLHQIWHCWVPDIHSRHQTEERLLLASQIAVWLQFLVICDLVEQRTPPTTTPCHLLSISSTSLGSIQQNKHICPQRSAPDSTSPYSYRAFLDSCELLC